MLQRTTCHNGHNDTGLSDPKFVVNDRLLRIKSEKSVRANNSSALHYDNNEEDVSISTHRMSHKSC